jgi:hypothetical protein
MVRQVLLLACLSATPSWAFKIASVVSPACHERMTLRAIAGLGLATQQRLVVAPVETVDERLARYFERLVPVLSGPSASPRVLNSFFVGVRHPDIEGVESIDTNGLRTIHLQPNDQELHFLRNRSTEGDVGNREAIRLGREAILRLVEESKQAFDAESGREQLVETWVDGYGRVRVRVSTPAFILGKALHALQDSFSHAYRTPDLRRIAVVQTYIDAFRRDYNEQRFGPRHSDSLDTCTAPEVAPIEQAATDASRELVEAAERYWLTGDRRSVDETVDRWFAPESGCSFGDGYCASPWVALGRRLETSGCSVGSSLWPLLLALGPFRLRRRTMAVIRKD